MSIDVAFLPSRSASVDQMVNHEKANQRVNELAASSDIGESRVKHYPIASIHALAQLASAFTLVPVGELLEVRVEVHVAAEQMGRQGPTETL